MVHQMVKLLSQPMLSCNQTTKRCWVRHWIRLTVNVQVLKQWEKKVRSASSLEELLRLADFPDWKLWKCRLRLQQPDNPSSTSSLGSHRSTRYAAESYSLEILKGSTRNCFCCSHLCVLPWCWVLSPLLFKPLTKSGSGHSACQGRRALTWQRSSAQTPPCFSSRPACPSTGLFYAARHAGIVIKHYVSKFQNFTAFLNHLTSKSTLTAKLNLIWVTVQQCFI